MTDMIGIDSMILIYAGLVPRKSGKLSKELGELGVRAKLLLHMRRKDIIVLPTIAVSEVLVPVPAAQRGLLLTELSGRFLCPSFDLQAAALAADLWSTHKKLPNDLQYKNRHVLRADAMIVAAAKSAGATKFYSHDKRCRALADSLMIGCDLPTHDPDDMFIVEDIRRGDV
ncbi:MAG TPA: hypothetical protein VMY42_27475 [Thermoguttaceae bacterium]|nr:hypothetical protein [Thermoguttaceae bacterium]